MPQFNQSTMVTGMVVDPTAGLANLAQEAKAKDAQRQQLYANRAALRQVLALKGLTGKIDATVSEGGNFEITGGDGMDQAQAMQAVYGTRRSDDGKKGTGTTVTTVQGHANADDAKSKITAQQIKNDAALKQEQLRQAANKKWVQEGKLSPVLPPSSTTTVPILPSVMNMNPVAIAAGSLTGGVTSSTAPSTVAPVTGSSSSSGSRQANSSYSGEDLTIHGTDQNEVTTTTDIEVRDYQGQLREDLQANDILAGMNATISGQAKSDVWQHELNAKNAIGMEVNKALLGQNTKQELVQGNSFAYGTKGASMSEGSSWTEKQRFAPASSGSTTPPARMGYINYNNQAFHVPIVGNIAKFDPKGVTHTKLTDEMITQYTDHQNLIDNFNTHKPQGIAHKLPGGGTKTYASDGTDEYKVEFDKGTGKMVLYTREQNGTKDIPWAKAGFYEADGSRAAYNANGDLIVPKGTNAQDVMKKVSIRWLGDQPISRVQFITGQAPVPAP